MACRQVRGLLILHVPTKARNDESTKKRVGVPPVEAARSGLPPRSRLLGGTGSCNIEFDALPMRTAEASMNLSQDIQSLTDFKRKTPEFLRQLKETGDPVVLTINGKAELVVQDAASYQRLFDLAERLETIQAVKEGLASADRGEGRPMDDVFDALEKDLRRAKPHS
jgi:prevent-host-death family protein